jgi:hypothetical protein
LIALGRPLIVPGNLLHKRRLVPNEQRHRFFEVIILEPGFSRGHAQESTILKRPLLRLADKLSNSLCQFSFMQTYAGILLALERPAFEIVR